MKKGELVLRLSMRSDPKLLCVVRAAVSEMAARVGFSESDVRSIVLALDEALTNVIRHAYNGSYDRPIRIGFFLGRSRAELETEDTLEIRVVDRGTPLDPKRMIGRSLDEVRPGGLGLHFIREIMDSVNYRHVAGRNYLRLRKSLPPASSPDPQQESI